MNNISSVNFQGKVHIMNGLSYKPECYIQRASKQLQKFVENKDYNIYIKQNYPLSKIDITVGTENEFLDKKGNTGSVHITSGVRKYTDTAKSIINEYNVKKQEIFENNLEKEHLKRDIKDLFVLLLYLLYFPIFLIKEDFKGIIDTIRCLQKKKG